MEDRTFGLYTDSEGNGSLNWVAGPDYLPIKGSRNEMESKAYKLNRERCEPGGFPYIYFSAPVASVS